jgi:SagB-type dehydrogenase family enzyme
MAAPDAASALYGGSGEAEMPRSPGGGPSLLALPPPNTNNASSASLAHVLAARRSERDFAAGAPLRLAAVAQLCWAAQGVTAPPEAPGAPVKGRTTPSAGALFPLQTFLVVGDNTVEVRAWRWRVLLRRRSTVMRSCIVARVLLTRARIGAQGLAPGVYWYRSAAHDVQRLRGDASARARLASDAACAQAWLAAAPAVLLIAAEPARTTERYGAQRGERYVAMEAGGAAQNVLLQAEALGLGASWVGAFHDGGVRDALGLPPSLVPLAVLPVGRRAPPEAPHVGDQQHAAAMAAAVGTGPARDTQHDFD